MAANGEKTSEDADMAECDGEKVVTMMDVLQEQEDFEDDANAVLGASDDKNCTYSKGYVKRQAIYACLTCCPEAKFDPMKRAGVCLACSLACHENHELVELYTKRNFRCDCGNPKFTQPCQFTPNKTDLNYENKYNQNFSGVYCSCRRPYPDPEATDEEEMLQCIICEDWLHINHLDATVPHNDQYAEMVCKVCMEDNDFLHDYSDIVVNVADKEIIVTDPDFDFPSIKKKISKEDKQENLTNGITETKAGKDDTEKVLDNINSIVEEKKDETSKDVDMTKATPDKGGDSTATEEEKSEQGGDSTATKDVQSEQNTEGIETGDTNPESATTTADKTEDQDNKNIKPEGQTENKETIETSKKEANESVDEQETEVTLSNHKDEENKDDNKTEDKAASSDATINNDEENKKDNNTEDNAAKPEATGTEPVESTVKEATIETNGEAASTSTKDDTDKIDTTEVISTATPEIKTDVANESLDKENELPTLNKRKLSTEEAEDKSPKKPKLDAKPCIRPRGIKRVFKGATFWPSNLRQKLCTCGECVAMYKDLAVLFLIDPDDTVTAYEALGQANNDGAPSSQYEKGLQALSSLDRVQQINALTEYNKMRDKLLDFLKSFKDRKEIVKEEDIKAFFAGMKPKREPDGVYFCR